MLAGITTHTHLLPIFMSWFGPAFWWRDSNILSFLFISRPASLLASSYLSSLKAKFPQLPIDQLAAPKVQMCCTPHYFLHHFKATRNCFVGSNPSDKNTAQKYTRFTGTGNRFWVPAMNESVKHATLTYTCVLQRRKLSQCRSFCHSTVLEMASLKRTDVSVWSYSH
jgi:hypothetical protein